MHFRTNKKKYKFLKLVEMFFHTQSSKPRDKLFALLNMAYDMVDLWQEDLKPAFNPDYDSTEQAILASYAKQFVKDGLALDLLYRAGSDKASDFCTWIPDLMNKRGNTKYPSTISTWDTADSGHGREFGAGAPLPPEAEVQSKMVNLTQGGHCIPVLCIKGIVFDSIQSCHPLKMGSGDTEIQFSVVLETLRRYISHLQFYPNAGRNWRDELLIKLLIGDSLGPLTASLSWPFFEQAVQEKWPQGFEKEILALQPDQDAHQYVIKSPESREIIQRFWQTAAYFTGKIPRAAVCIIGRGYRGLVPGAAIAGDKLFIPRGAKVPFVLRKKTGTDYYTLIGESYLHGLMYYPKIIMDHLTEEDVCLV
jgi:hypothetical protein